MLVQEDDAKINEVKKKLKAEQKCRSNDLHIIALAIVSGARLLYSQDQLLQQDFRDKALIDQPRGKIYPQFDSEDKNINWLRRNRKLCTK